MITFNEAELQTINTVWDWYCKLFHADPSSIYIQIGGKRIAKLYHDSSADQETYSIAFSVAENGSDWYTRPDWRKAELEGFTTWLSDYGTLTDPE